MRFDGTWPRRHALARRGAIPYRQIAEQVKAHPGEWILLATSAPLADATRIRAGFWRQGVKVARRPVGFNTVDFYACFLRDSGQMPPEVPGKRLANPKSVTQADGLTMSPEALDRFLAKTDRSAGPDGCWPWLGTLDRHGYGRFQMDGRTHFAHRVSFRHWTGPTTAGLQVDHACHNGSGCTAADQCLHRRCVNPAHLQLVTNRENAIMGTGFASMVWATHCKRGHPFDEANTRRTLKGGRECVACTVARRRARSKSAA